MVPIAVEGGVMEYMENFCYFGTVIVVNGRIDKEVH